MTEPAPYTEDDVALVAAATEQHYIVAGRTDAMGNSPCVCDQWWDAAGDNPGWDQHMAEVTLAALADAGRLLPVDAERVAEYGVWWHIGDSDGIAYSTDAIGDLDRAHQIGKERIGDLGLTRYTLHQRTHRHFADGSSWVGPWVPATEGDAGD